MNNNVFYGFVLILNHTAQGVQIVYHIVNDHKFILEMFYLF